MPFRIYYLTGGVLVVAYLAVGEMLLVLPGRTVTRLAAATMLFLTFAATAAVLAARVDTGELARAGATPPNGALKGPWPTVMAIALNSAGTLVLLAGSILSARPPARPAAAAGGGGGAGDRARLDGDAARQLHVVRARPGRGRDPDPARPGYAETFVWLTIRAACDLRREAWLRWIADRDAALSTRTTRRRCAAATCSESPASTASSRRRNSVLIWVR